MGNSNIENSGVEDSYSYKKQDGSFSKVGKWGDDWVTPQVGASINAAVKRANITIQVNDGSAYNPSYNLGHASHSSGVDIDIQYITTNGNGSNNVNILTNADKLLNTNFVNELKLAGFAEFLTNGTISGTKFHKDHENHFHIGL